MQGRCLHAMLLAARAAFDLHRIEILIAHHGARRRKMRGVCVRTRVGRAHTRPSTRGELMIAQKP
jgi:hypothetical protein